MKLNFDFFKKKKEEKSIYEIMKSHEQDYTHKPMELSLSVKYNTQRDNKNFALIPESSQCGYTTIAMLLSRFIPRAEHDEFISDIIINFENVFLGGKSKYRFGAAMGNHVKIYNHYIEKFNLNKEVVFIPSDGTLLDIVTGLKNSSAVEFSWKPTKSGHFSAIIGYSEIKKSLLIHDPWAKFDFKKKRYANESGNDNWHSIEDITPYMNASSASENGYRIIYLKDKT